MRFDRLFEKKKNPSQAKPSSLYLNHTKAQIFGTPSEAFPSPLAAKAIFEFGSNLVTRIQPKKLGGRESSGDEKKKKPKHKSLPISETKGFHFFGLDSQEYLGADHFQMCILQRADYMPAAPSSGAPGLGI